MALILVADDDASIADLIKRSLESRGHQVEVVSDGLELTEKAQNARPALIVCDIHMPNVYGTGAYEVLQRNPQTASIPVIFVTGIPVEKAIKIVPKSPNVRLLQKPFDPEQLDAAIKELLAAK